MEPSYTQINFIKAFHNWIAEPRFSGLFIVTFVAVTQSILFLHESYEIEYDVHGTGIAMDSRE